MKNDEIVILIKVLMDVLSKHKNEISYEEGLVIEKTINVISKYHKH